MENQTYMNSTLNNKKMTSMTLKQGKQNLIKKRPSTTKLDLQKIFQQSIELTQIYKKLSKQNKILKSQHQKVQTTKSNRQNLISMVQRIVQQKAKDLKKNPTNQSSWLVHKLNTKIYQLKNKIEQKQKAIKQVQMSKQSQMIREKQSQIQCIDQILEWADSKKFKSSNQNNFDNFQEDQEINQKNTSFLNQIKQVVWMEQEIREKQEQILEAERLFQQEQRQVKKIMMQISKKKIQLKQIKGLEQQYYHAQQEFKQQKKKRQQRLAGNKTYLDELIQSRHNELNKLQELKQKYSIIQIQQSKNIQQLQKKLQKLKKQYEQKNKARQQLVFRVVEEPNTNNKQKWVKRVQFSEVKNIAKNLNYFIALKRVSKQYIMKTFFKDQDQQLSIKQVVDILQQYPFEIQNQNQRQLLARYCIEDAGQGYFMQDMDTSQSIPIIKSVLSKIIGDVRIYSEQEEKYLQHKTGDIMFKFHSLVQQNIQSRQGNIKKCSKQTMQEAIIATELDLNHDQINFIVLYLFSLSHNIDQLEISNLVNILQKGVKWIKKE